MCNKIFGFYGCDFLELPELKELDWKESDKLDYLDIIKESNFAILHNGKLEESDFDEAKPGAIFIRVSQGGQENLRKERGFKTKDGVYCLHVWNQQPLKNNAIITKLLNELLNLTTDKAGQILSGNLNGLSENLKLLFSKPGNSDILCYWWMLCKVYFLYKAKNKDDRTNGLLKDKEAWKLILPDDKAKDQVDKAKNQVDKAKDQVEKDIDYMCKSRGITISEDELKDCCFSFIERIYGKPPLRLDNLYHQLQELFPTQGGLK